VTMSDLVSREKFYIPKNRLTKSFDSNSLIGRKITCDSRAINKDVSIVRTEISISRGHNPSSYEVPLPCLL
jgi:cell shape-determining protein MreC